MAHEIRWGRLYDTCGTAVAWLVCTDGCPLHRPHHELALVKVGTDEAAQHVANDTYPRVMHRRGVPGWAIKRMLRLIAHEPNARYGACSAKGCRPLWEAEEDDDAE